MFLGITQFPFFFFLSSDFFNLFSASFAKLHPSAYILWYETLLQIFHINVEKPYSFPQARGGPLFTARKIGDLKWKLNSHRKGLQ